MPLVRDVLRALAAAAAAAAAAAGAAAPPPASPLFALTGPGLTDYVMSPGGASSVWDADLLVPLQALGATWLVGGDVLDGEARRSTWLSPNCVGLVSAEGFAARVPVAWQLRAGAGGLPAPAFPRTGKSTVPAGFVALPAAAAAAGPAVAAPPTVPVYAFFMNVSDWSTGVPGNVSAQGLLVRGAAFGAQAPPVFEQTAVYAAAMDGLLVNAAPVVSPLDGFLYIFATERYRASPVFLAQVDATGRSIVDKTQYAWFNAPGLAPGAYPTWSEPGSEMDAFPLPIGGGGGRDGGTSLSGVGELSAIYHAAAKRFVLCAFNYSRVPGALPQMLCAAAAQPWGAWSAPQVVVDGSEPWFPTKAGGPYGGYVLEPAATNATHDPSLIKITVLLSLWLPYRVFAFETSFLDTLADGAGRGAVAAPPRASLGAPTTWPVPRSRLLAAGAPAAPARSFSYDDTDFLRDGAPFRIVSAEIHYQRAHPQDWAARLALLRAAGFNCVTTYVEWSLHEPTEGKFDFSSPDRNLAAWLTAIHAADLLAIVRVGPYITAELDFGGLPFWLAAVPDIKLRTNDTVYLSKVDRYFDALAPVLVPSLYSAGGPIIDLQIEDDTDRNPPIPPAVTHAYYAHLVDGLRSRGLVDVLINSLCNPNRQCFNAVTPGAFLALEFGVGNADPTKVCRSGDFRAVFPKGPCLVLETYTAWYDQVGEGHANIDAGTFAAWIDALLLNNASVSVYMGFGGTNFGFIGGADVNWNESAHAYVYAPMTTSYSYGAPISEGGRASDKWQALRDVFAKHVPVPPGPPPAPVAIFVPAPVPAPEACADLFDAAQLGLFQRVSTAAPLSFEELGQAFGFVLYSAELASLPASGSNLSVSSLQDRALVFVDRVFQDGGVLGWSERPVRMGTTVFPSGGADAPTLQLLVENTGRCSAEIVDASCARKGLLGNVSLEGRTLQPTAGGNWSSTLLPFDDLAALLPRLPWQSCASRSGTSSPRFLRFALNLPASPAPAPATFLVVDGFGHGFVSVNSFNLGRFSCRGPVRTLFVPAAVLVAGARNEIVVFETDYDAPTCRNSSATRALTFVDEPLWFENE